MTPKKSDSSANLQKFLEFIEEHNCKVLLKENQSLEEKLRIAEEALEKAEYQGQRVLMGKSGGV